MNQTRRFEHAPASVGAARRFASEALQDSPAETLEVVALMVSELASNCVKHAGGRFELTIIKAAREIRVEVTDHAGGEPSMRSPRPTDPTGRGLRIVDMLAAAWGVERSAGEATTVWFTVPSGASRGVRSSQAREAGQAQGPRRSRGRGSKDVAHRTGRWPSAQLGGDHGRVRRREAAAVGLRGH